MKKLILVEKERREKSIIRVIKKKKLVTDLTRILV
jgi:hypothetical protein